MTLSFLIFFLNGPAPFNFIKISFKNTYSIALNVLNMFMLKFPSDGLSQLGDVYFVGTQVSSVGH